MHISRLAAFLTLVFSLLGSSTTFAQQGRGHKSFGKNSPFTLEDLPAGKLKSRLQTLDPKVRAKAMRKLHGFEFHEFDAAKHLRVDVQGEIYIVCPQKGCEECGKAHHDHTPEAVPLGSPESDSGVSYAPVSVSTPPAYNSKPGAPNHIYLDFNGAIVAGKGWNINYNVASWDCAAWSSDADITTFSDAEQADIRRMWERVAEDFAPFNVNVTTDITYDPDNYTGDKNRVGWLLITPTLDKNGVECPHFGAGGIAYLGGFGSFNYHALGQPAWVGPMGAANIAEAASHEMGHNLGLSHDGLTSGAEYYGGHAAVAGVSPSWGPLMGVGYGQNVSQWSRSTEYFNGNVSQDDLGILSEKLSYRTDDHGGTFGTATPWISGTVDQRGIIERRNETDTFTFNAAAGTISLNASAYKCDTGTWGANLDILLELYDNSQNLLASSNPVDLVDASVSVNVPAGRYYVMVKPVAAGNPLNDPPSGYTNYSSLGQYRITGNFIPADGVLLSSPGGGESWFVGSPYQITWGTGIPGDVKIELLKAGFLHSTIAASTTNDGSHTWTIPWGITLSNDYQIRITSIAQPDKSDQSASNFTITTSALSDALDSTGLHWVTSGDVAWFRQTTTIRDGVDAAQSGAIGNSQTSSLETSVVGPGTLTFWWRVNSEDNSDFLIFYFNGVEQTGPLAKISGSFGGWVQKTVSIPSGSHAVKWSYVKDGNGAANSDSGWVDQVVFTPDTAPDIAVEQPVATDLTDGTATRDFGTVSLGSTSSALTFTIRNTGNADLTGLEVSKGGAHGADYTLGSLGATALAPGASTTFTATFSPADYGTRTASIQITSNDLNESPFDINFTGIGEGPGTLVMTPPGGLVSYGGYGGAFSPSSFQYTLINPGNTTINWTAANFPSWVTLSATSGTLAAGASFNVAIFIDSSANSMNTGSYNSTVTFTNTTNGSGNTTRPVSLTIHPAAATVTLENLAQTYDGNPKTVTVATDPASLSNSVTYNGSITAPINAGSYSVVATISDPSYEGSSSGTLVIGKTSQTITFASLSPVLDNAAPITPGATASSTLAVSYASSNHDVATISGNTVIIVGVGSAAITASQAGDANYHAATNVSQTLTVGRSNPLARAGGPYHVLVGQSLSLNGGGSQPSHGTTITAYDWDLNNDNTFGDVSGNPLDVSYAALTTTWGRNLGYNTIQLRVTDSSGKTSIAPATLILVASLTWDANATMAGQTNGPGAWLDANQWWNGAANTGWVPGANAIFGGPNTSGGAVTIASPLIAHQLIFNAYSGSYTLGTAGQTLTLNNGINKTSASAAASIISPILIGADQAWTNNSASLLTASSTVDTAGYALTVNGTGNTTISGAVSGAGGIVKNGAGTLVLNNVANSFSGGITLRSGILNVTVDTHLGNASGGITFDGGQCIIPSINLSANRIITVNNGGGAIRVNKNNNFTTTGKLTGSGVMTLLSVGGSGSQPTYNFLSTANDFTGGLLFESGTRFSANSFADSANHIVFNKNTDTISTFVYETGAIAPLVLSSRAIQINSASALTVQLQNKNTSQGISIQSNLQATGAGAKTFELISATGPANVFGGTITDGSDGGILTLVKSGAGNWTLSGNNAYTGTTSVTAGKLFINGNQSSATGSVSVSANATLGGTGSISGTTTIAANGRLEFDLNSPAASHDPLNFANGLTFSGASVLAITTSGNVSPGTYTLLTSPGGITGVAPATLSLPSGWTASVSISGNNLLLTVNTLPTYTLTFNCAGGSVVSPITQYFGTAVTPPANPTRAGYTFVGWSPAVPATMPAGNLTVTAQWTVNTYTVTFNPNGGNAPNPTGKLVTYGSSYGALASVTRADAIFRGWFTAAAGGTKITSRTIVTTAADHTLYAQWTQNFPEADATRGGNPIVSGGYDAVSGTNAGVGTPLTFAITNNGAANLTLGGVTKSGESNCSVVINTLPVGLVPPVGTTNLVLTVTPAALGAWSFALSIPNNDADENPYTWTVHGVSRGTTTTAFTASADTYINASAINTNHGSETTIGLNANAAQNRIGLINFDLSSVPPGSTVSAAGIQFTISAGRGGSVQMFNTTGAWGAATATWANSNAIIGNVSYGLTPMTTTTSGTPLTITLNPDGINTILGWINNTGNKNGFSIKTNFSSTGASPNALFSTNHTANTSYHPKLSLTYTGTPLAPEMHVTRSGSLVGDGGGDTVPGTVAANGTQLAYAIANLGNANLTLTTPVTSSATVNCSVVVDSQPGNTVAASTSTNLAVTVTPTAAGPWSATLSIANNDPNEAPYNWTITGTATGSYTSWASGTFTNPFTDTAPGSNPDGDAFINLLEFAFGTDPTSPASGPLVYVSGGDVIKAGSPILQNFAAVGQPADFRAVFARRKDYIAAGLTYTVEFSADLGMWTASVTNPTLETGASSSGEMEAVSVLFPPTVPLQAGGFGTTQFFRLRVTGN